MRLKNTAYYRKGKIKVKYSKYESELIPCITYTTTKNGSNIKRKLVYTGYHPLLTKNNKYVEKLFLFEESKKRGGDGLIDMKSQEPLMLFIVVEFPLLVSFRLSLS